MDEPQKPAIYLQFTILHVVILQYFLIPSIMPDW